MKTTIIAGGLAAVSLAALVAGSALAQQAASPAAASPAAARAAHATRHAQPVSQAEFVQARVTRLTTLDTNHDGTVTADEMRAGGQARRAEVAARRFDRFDADKNGQISRTEFDAARPAHGPRGGDRAGRQGRHGGQRMARHGGHQGPIVIADVQSKLTEGFARLDTDHDGMLSPTERQAGHAVRRDRMQQRRAERQNHAPATSTSPSAPASE